LASRSRGAFRWWHSDCSNQSEMLWAVSAILAVLWLLGCATAHMLGGFIHILLVVAIAVLVIQVTMGKREA